MSAIWPGALCVSEGAYSDDELLRIESEVGERISAEQRGLLLGGSAVLIDGVVASTVEPMPQLQLEFDRRYGPGVVRLTSLLVPIGP